MKVYISGPITGEKDHGKKFAIAEKYFSDRGHKVVNPEAITKELDDLHESAPGSLPWSEYMREDIKALVDCDAIAMLPAWGESRGARLERQVADALGLIETRVPQHLFGEGGSNGTD